MNDNKPVRGPMYIEATPLMVTADIEPLVHANVGELLDLLMGEEFFEEFIAMASEEPPKDHDGHAAQKLAFEEMQARLTERMSTKVALTGPQAMRVAGRMAALGRPLAEAAEKKDAGLRLATEGLTAGERAAALIKHPSHAATRRHLAANPLPEQQDRRSA